jgi:hypothetical protein
MGKFNATAGRPAVGRSYKRQSIHNGSGNTQKKKRITRVIRL